jgi:hypothetical protein
MKCKCGKKLNYQTIKAGLKECKACRKYFCKTCKIGRTVQSKSGLCRGCSAIEKGLKERKYKRYTKCLECGIDKKETRSKYCHSCAKSGERNSFYGKTHSNITREKLSKSRSNAIANGSYNDKSNSRGYKGYYYSVKNDEEFYFDSATELLRMVKLDGDSSILKWTKNHGIILEYFKDYKRNYHPDFLITYKDGTIVLEEVKGYINSNNEEKKKVLKKYTNKMGYKYSWVTVSDFTVGREYRNFLKDFKRDLIAGVNRI